MDHRGEAMLGQHRLQQRPVGEVAHHQRRLLRAPAMAGVEAVVHDRPVPGVQEMADDEAADIAAAARHQHVQPSP